MRKVVRSVDGILDDVEKESEQDFLVKGTWETFKKGEKIAMNPSVQKGAKIVQKVGVETVKVATPIVAKGVATGIKEGGKLAFKVALGANSMGNERERRKRRRKSWRTNRMGIVRRGKRMKGFSRAVRCRFHSEMWMRKKKKKKRTETCLEVCSAATGRMIADTAKEETNRYLWTRERLERFIRMCKLKRYVARKR